MKIFAPPFRLFASSPRNGHLLSRLRGLSALALAVSALPGCAGKAEPQAFAGELEFRGEQAFLPGFAFDSGWLPAGSPVAIRAAVGAGGGVTVVARATTDGNSLTPVPGSGQLSVEGSLSLEISAQIDTSGFMYDGVVDSFEYAIESASTSFEPFGLDASATVSSTLPPSELGRVPIPSLPGATLILEVTGGTLSTAFAGTCADARDGFGQYTGTLTTGGTVACAASVEIEIPIVGTESFGPFAFDVPVPELASPIDLGTVSLATGESVDAMGVCGDAGLTGSGGVATGVEPGGSSSGDAPGTGGSAGEGDSTGPSGETDTDPGTTTDVMPTTGGEMACMPGDCGACADRDACFRCAQSEGGECFVELEACHEIPDCSLLVSCTQDCTDQECVDDCLAESPEGEPAFSALIDCIVAICS